MEAAGFGTGEQTTRSLSPEQQRKREEAQERLRQHEEAQRQRKERERDERRVQLWADSGVEERHRKADLDTLCQHQQWAWAWQRAQGCVDRGGVLLLHGEWGNGKTQMGVELIRRACKDMKRAMYVRARDIGIKLRMAYSGAGTEYDAINTFVKPDLLVIDELHERFDTEHERKTLTLILDKRYAAMKPTVLIANLSAKEFVNVAGPAITDRLREGGGAIHFDWGSFRGAP